MLSLSRFLVIFRMRDKLVVLGSILMVFLLVWIIVQPVKAEKFQSRGLYINSARASDTTFYIVSLRYTTPASIGSLKMEFCTTPIPSFACVAPSGLDASAATLAAQSGETGFSITSQTANSLVLSRSPSVTGASLSSYRLDNMVNPDGTGIGADPAEPEGEKTNFYIRLTSHTTTNGTGPETDFGAVSNTITPELALYTQVPPILMFCVAGVIHDDECLDMDGYYVDFGELNSNETYSTKSEMQAWTNAQYGYSITTTGNTLTSGIRSIPAIASPTQSLVGVGQFGINLTDNTDPDIGADPVGPGTNAVLNATYTTPDQYLYQEGDTLVSSSGVTMTRKFTVSYILNVPENQSPGVYSTTITYVCLAGF